ncbi:hypothetical protein GOBAR_AA20859 [Gossypium barbadense]|uniref:Uncharacterized protein n=1 Tax=Gossypium barbadense TaxID=3634 RepID=A0A2P5X8Y8_GOSBA|nr:hypothetical protein GOBAR_AA20859 [Gossypium barbadense]
MGPFFSLSGAGKWLGLVAAIWVQAICGNNYTFANYSDALKSLMSLTQLQLNNLSVAKDVGKAFGVVAGFASDCLPTSVLLIIGSVEGFIGYGAQWLVVSRRIHPLPYWQMCVFLCMGGNSTTWMNTAVLVTCMRNFPKNRGPVSGILKGYVGLSTAIFTDICTALFSSDPSTFLFILAVVPAIVCLTATFFLHEIPTPTSNPSELRQETLYFHVFNGIAIILAVYLLAFDITGNHGRVLSLAFAVGLLVLLATPLSVPLYSFISKPLSDSDIERPMKVSLKFGTPRPLWNAASQVLMAIGYIAMALALPGSLYIGSILVGICYGVRLTITVPVASELFGLKYYGLLYNILILNLPLGSFLFSGLLAGYLYDVQATVVDGGGNTCVGAQCYCLVFVIMALTCVVGLGLDVLLAVRTRNVYVRIHESKRAIAVSATDCSSAKY